MLLLEFMLHFNLRLNLHRLPAEYFNDRIHIHFDDNKVVAAQNVQIEVSLGQRHKIVQMLGKQFYVDRSNEMINLQ